MNIAFIPIDNRPVCYTLPEQICALNDDINLLMPDRELLGDLTKCADVEGIFNWLENLHDIDSVVMCLDTIAYGGFQVLCEFPITILTRKKKSIGINGAKRFLTIHIVWINSVQCVKKKFPTRF